LTEPGSATSTVLPPPAQPAAGTAQPGGVGPHRADPRATYRLQLNAGFGFEAAAALAPYLEALGVSHVYASPYLRAMPGSAHGYDVVDPTQVNPELGGAEGHAAFCAALGEHGLGQVLDVVPNHMAIGGIENPWWWDVLENGQASWYADVFDVDWAHPEPHLRERVLLPVLGDHYGRVLEAGDLRLAWDGRRFTIRYYEHRFPVAPPTLDALLTLAAGRVGSDELGFLADAFAAIPPSSLHDRSSVERRHRDKEVLGDRLAALAGEDPAVAEAIEAAVAATNADLETLDRLIERQNYRLSWWRAARRDLGYRRFFDVTGLVGLRIEDERVFRETHGLVLEWLADGVIDGLRIDHPDGLLDPEGYLRRLRWASPRAWLVVEKILEPGEELRRSWPVAGTSGYDFLRRASGLFVDPAGEEGLSALHARITGEARPFAQIAVEAKAEVLRESLGSELGRLTSLLVDVLERHRRHRDHTRHDLHEALAALLVAFPVYRTYVRVEPREDDRPVAQVAPEDEAVIREAVAGAAAARPDLPGDLFEILGDLLLLRLPGELEVDFALRFQQLTGPVMAKGVEDTAFYRDLRLVSLNEVGGDPGRFGIDSATFHAQNAAAQARWPLGMVTTSTHDTKRSEDVRARLHVLSEIPGRWAAAVEEWRRGNASRRGEHGPDGHAEYLLYQTLAGAWPVEGERLAAYLRKALREARRRTSWTDPDEAYERSVLEFAEQSLADPGFRSSLERFVGEILRAGRINSLAQTLIKLTVPGVPDVYQGTELWDLSLVDPDNRRPVDFELRAQLLATLVAPGAPDPEALAALLDDPGDPGTPKLALVRAALGVRNRHPEVFGTEATYRALEARGDHDGNVVAFLRSDRVAVVVPRLTLGLDGWGDTAIDLPKGRWWSELTGEEVGTAGDTRVVAGDTPDAAGETQVAVGELLDRFPVALLVRHDE
jgi:(1->4)-alpha-D-glucan 1-alpha-D-glucosylmutase